MDNVDHKNAQGINVRPDKQDPRPQGVIDGDSPFVLEDHTHLVCFAVGAEHSLEEFAAWAEKHQAIVMCNAIHNEGLHEENLWQNMGGAIAHTFHNAFAQLSMDLGE